MKTFFFLKYIVGQQLLAPLEILMTKMYAEIYSHSYSNLEHTSMVMNMKYAAMLPVVTEI